MLSLSLSLSITPWTTSNRRRTEATTTIIISRRRSQRDNEQSVDVIDEVINGRIIDSNRCNSLQSVMRAWTQKEKESRGVEGKARPQLVVNRNCLRMVFQFFFPFVIVLCFGCDFIWWTVEELLSEAANLLSFYLFRGAALSWNCGCNQRERDRQRVMIKWEDQSVLIWDWK